jgi:putative hydrolase of the HAD superfamily
MLKAVIFDLNGVFITSPKLSDRFEKDFNISSAEFIPGLKTILAEVRKPNAKSVFSYWKPLLKKWDIKMNEREFLDYWFNAEEPSSKMIDLAKDLRKNKIAVISLSNNFRERSEYYLSFSWMNEAIDRAYFSWQTGFIKPDIRAWQLILSERALKPEECLYFDDKEENCVAAESIGIKAYPFSTPDKAREDIEKYLTSAQ